jgi:hypothetical protein
MPSRAEHTPPDPAAPQAVAEESDRTDPDPLPVFVEPARTALPAPPAPLTPPPPPSAATSAARRPPPVPLGGRAGAWSRRTTVVSDLSAILAAEMDKVADGDDHVTGAVPTEGPADDYIVEVVAPDPGRRR